MINMIAVRCLDESAVAALRGRGRHALGAGGAGMTMHDITARTFHRVLRLPESHGQIISQPGRVSSAVSSPYTTIVC